MNITEQMKWIVKQRLTAIENKDWSMLRETDIYKRKCMLSVEQIKWIDAQKHEVK